MNMTKKEAIRIAQGLINDFKCESETMVEFCNVVIKALEQEPCEDCISRQTVLDSLVEYMDAFYNENGRMMYSDHIITNADCNDLKEWIRSFPSVTPQPKTGLWIDDEFGSKCSCCGIHTHLDKFDRPMKFKHCSMCGAKMEVGKWQT